jgi:ribosome maturation factor RimP
MRPLFIEGSVEELRKIILPIIEDNGFDLVELAVIRAGGRAILKFLVDKPQCGIDIAECARLNRLIGDALDASDGYVEPYVIEVSSPGLDRPLIIIEDFMRAINKRVRFFLNEKVNGLIEMEGFIKGVEGDIIIVDTGTELISIGINKINRGKQVI